MLELALLIEYVFNRGSTTPGRPGHSSENKRVVVQDRRSLLLLYKYGRPELSAHSSNEVGHQALQVHVGRGSRKLY